MSTNDPSQKSEENISSRASLQGKCEVEGRIETRERDRRAKKRQVDILSQTACGRQRVSSGTVDTSPGKQTDPYEDYDV